MVEIMENLKIIVRDIGSIASNPLNSRIHTKKQINQIASSISEFGFTNPILIDSQNTIIAGHGRLEAAKVLKLNQVPTIILEDMTEDQIRAYVIADNKIALNAGWDKELLATEFEYLDKLDLDFDLSITGFETSEIDLIFDSIDEGDDEADQIPQIDRSCSAVSQIGDIWTVGKHQFICGDATKTEPYRAILKDELAQMVFTDPPYNVPIDGHVSGLGKVKHSNFVMASGEMSEKEFKAFLKLICSHLVNYSAPGSIHFICMDWRHISELLSATKGIFHEFKNVCVWNKSNAGMGTLYRSKHEFVFVFKNGSEPHINNVMLGAEGRYRTNVWDYPGVNSFSDHRDKELSLHPTVKPVAMVADAIKDCSNRKDIILDCFLGSGTTLIAAEQTGRTFRGIELDPHYVDVSIQRYQDLTGEAVIHEASGLTFAEMKERRLKELRDQPILQNSSTEATEAPNV